MTVERVLAAARRYREALADPAQVAGASEWIEAADVGHELLESMVLSRHIDRAAHELRAEGLGLYTISSAGHESDAVLGRLVRLTDPSLVHYRSTALVIERARQRPDYDPVREIVLSLVGARTEPVSGGRHKVLGGGPLGLVPQTSTVASHLPRALGLAFALEHGRLLGAPADTPEDALVMAGIGDAGINHSTWLGAVNAAAWLLERGRKLPLLLTCEDNGLGISVRSPPGWVERRLRAVPNAAYYSADGSNLAEVYAQASAAVSVCRAERRPVVLHLRCVRLLPHAGGDVDSAYRSRDELRAAEESDPIIAAALALVKGGALSAAEAVAIDERARARVDAAMDEARRAEPLGSAREIALPLPAPRLDRSGAQPRGGARVGGAPPLTLARGVNAALDEALSSVPGAFLLGEDVGVKGGVHGVTLGLQARYGALRVFDTLLDEQTILGLAIGTAARGCLPIAEIQYLAFLHNAIDQLRGEAATLPFFSRGELKNPCIVRIASFADPRAPGGHFHNENSVGPLRDIPGLALAVPARADDALELYRTALRLAREAGMVTVVLEPAALYHERDLESAGDRGWLAADTGRSADVGRARVYRDSARDLTIATYGRGVRVALRAASRLEREHRIAARVLDVRWLAPLPVEDLVEHARETRGLLFVDEARRTGNVSEQVAALWIDRRLDLPLARLAAEDCPLPIGPAARLLLPDEDAVVRAALDLRRHPAQGA